MSFKGRNTNIGIAINVLYENKNTTPPPSDFFIIWLLRMGWGQPYFSF